MNDFIYNGTVPILYGAGQIDTVAAKIAAFAKNVLIVAGGSFERAGHLEKLKNKLQEAGVTSVCLGQVKEPYVSKAQEGITLCLQNNIQAVIGIGGGVCMDLAKSIAVGAANPETPLEKYLTYELSTQGLPHLPVVTIPTNPMSGSETNADVQLTLDESNLQVGCAMTLAEFAWLNPEYAMSLPNHILIYGQMTAFAQCSFNYLNLTRSLLAEQYAVATMKTILTALRKSIADPSDADARGTLLLCSALSISGINDLGREIEFIPYPLQSFAQRYLGLNYPQALTGLFPYWMKAIFRASSDKTIFYQYFEEILQVSTSNKTDEEILHEAMSALHALYREFGIAFSYGENAKDPKNRDELMQIIDSFGPMPCRIMPVTTEILADIIEDVIAGNEN